MTYKFYLKDVPDTLTVFSYIRKNTDLDFYIKKCESKFCIDNLIRLKHDFNLDEIKNAVLDAYNKYGYKGWRSSEGISSNYGGLSLTFNPDYAESVETNQQTLGTEKNNLQEFFYNQSQKFSYLKNTYFDSYSFRRFSPCVTETKLESFLKSFKRSHIRSRIGIINAKNIDENLRKSFGWHRDENIFENLRLNIPIQTDETFLFQLENQEPVHLSYGNIYTWNTNKPHRVFPKVQKPRTRIHLVFGFSPWFDYSFEDDAFISNEFYGKMHPIDMLINGHIHDKIKGTL